MLVERQYTTAPLRCRPPSVWSHYLGSDFCFADLHIFFKQGVSSRFIFRVKRRYKKISRDGLPKMADTICDTRLFKPVSSVVTSSRAASAFSARCVRSIFSSAYVFFLAAKLVFKFSVSRRLTCNLELVDIPLPDLLAGSSHQSIASSVQIRHSAKNVPR